MSEPEVLLTIRGWLMRKHQVERVSLTPKDYDGIASDHSYSVEVWVEKNFNWTGGVPDEVKEAGGRAKGPGSNNIEYDLT